MPEIKHMAHRLTRAAKAFAKFGPTATMISYGAKRHLAAQKLVEFAGLAKLVRSFSPRVVVEIGTRSGGTLWAWTRLATDDAIIIGIDLPGGAFGGGLRDEDRRRLPEYARGSQVLRMIEADSHAPETKGRLIGELGARPIDLLFIDGDHTYEGVKADYEMYAPLVRPGGLVVLHDILPHDDPDTHVDALWDDLKLAFKHCEFLDPGDVRSHGQWGGIGVLYKPNGANPD